MVIGRAFPKPHQRSMPTLHRMPSTKCKSWWIKRGPRTHQNAPWRGMVATPAKFEAERLSPAEAPRRCSSTDEEHPRTTARPCACCYKSCHRLTRALIPTPLQIQAAGSSPRSIDRSIDRHQGWPPTPTTAEEREQQRRRILLLLLLVPRPQRGGRPRSWDDGRAGAWVCWACWGSWCCRWCCWCRRRAPRRRPRLGGISRPAGSRALAR